MLIKREKVAQHKEQENCGSAGTRVMLRPAGHHRTCASYSSKHGDSLVDLTNCKKDAAHELLSVIRKGNFEELQDVLRSKPDLNVFVNGQTALHYCLLLGRDVSWLKQLVLSGANPNLSNLDGWHPIHLAAYSGHQEILTYLITCNSRAVI